MEFLHHHFYGNTILAWLVAVGAFLACWAAMALLKRFAVSRLAAWAKATPTDLDDFLVDLVASARPLFIILVSLVIGALTLRFGPAVDLVLFRILVVTLLLQAAFWGSRLIEFLIARQVRRRLAAGATPETEASLQTSMSAIRMTARFVLYVLVLLLALDNLGVDVTALIAGLGVGGIAVALAVQNILGDLFASLSIILDKPFVLGDFIIAGSEMGTVEKIGLKTTRVKSLTGEQIIFSNADLLQSRVRNYKRMAERRVLFRFGVTYQATAQQLRRIPDIVREIVQAQPSTRFDRAHFQKFGDSSLDFEVVYFVLSADYNLYAGIEHQVNLALLERFAAEGIAFAYPTRTLHIESARGLQAAAAGGGPEESAPT